MGCCGCRRTGQACPGARDDFARPDGPLTFLPTGQRYSSFPAPWSIVDEQAEPVVDEGFFDVGVLNFPMMPCCARDQNWSLEVTVAAPAVGALIEIGFTSTTYAEQISAFITIPGTDVAVEPIQMGFDFFSVGPFEFFNPDAVLPSTPATYKVTLAPNGFAVYVDGVPYAFTPTADLPPVVFSELTDAAVAVFGVGDPDLPVLTSLSAECAASISTIPFTSTEAPERGSLIDNLGNHLVTNLGDHLTWKE